MRKGLNGGFMTGLDSFNVEMSEPDAFAGGTTDARGDKDGTNATFTLYTVTGDVLVRIFGVCTTAIVGAATLEVGVAGNVKSLIDRIASASDLIASEIWLDATPTILGVDLLANVLGPYIIVNGLDIIETTGTADITAGQVHYVCLWSPLSRDGNVVSAV